jgi:hypothetical protein
MQPAEAYPYDIFVKKISFTETRLTRVVNFPLFLTSSKSNIPGNCGATVNFDAAFVDPEIMYVQATTILYTIRSS